ncbi:hypothetical protein L1987_67230 [Smallanthus sonchifolius]|uniref:Uncharacterized protein n=1 Tax=Smallanthus sonchifolius TaxID=185202 RepID=A0ACB9BZB7_9ASTR|nr:hypothetical protein L1987_67230 [Smallanthus sonchifolius]
MMRCNNSGKGRVMGREQGQEKKERFAGEKPAVEWMKRMGHLYFKGMQSSTGWIWGNKFRRSLKLEIEAINGDGGNYRKMRKSVLGFMLLRILCPNSYCSKLHSNGVGFKLENPSGEFWCMVCEACMQNATTGIRVRAGTQHTLLGTFKRVELGGIGHGLDEKLLSNINNMLGSNSLNATMACGGRWLHADEPVGGTSILMKESRESRPKGVVGKQGYIHMHEDKAHDNIWIRQHKDPKLGNGMKTNPPGGCSKADHAMGSISF